MYLLFLFLFSILLFLFNFSFLYINEEFFIFISLFLLFSILLTSLKKQSVLFFYYKIESIYFIFLYLIKIGINLSIFSHSLLHNLKYKFKSFILFEIFYTLKHSVKLYCLNLKDKLNNILINIIYIILNILNKNFSNKNFNTNTRKFFQLPSNKIFFFNYITNYNFIFETCIFLKKI